MHKSVTDEMIREMQPRRGPGRPPIVTHCPFCHRAFNKTEMKKHRNACAHDHRNAPPQRPVMPQDLENQQLSSDPLERLRQIDQREQDRMQRS